MHLNLHFLVYSLLHFIVKLSNLYLESLNLWPLKYKMNYHKCIASNQKDEFIAAEKVKWSRDWDMLAFS